MYTRFNYQLILSALITITAALLFTHLPVYAKAPTYQCRVVAEYPHDPQTSTQGLFIHDGKLYESSGGYGSSFVIIAELETGRAVSKFKYDNRYFAEGIARYKDKLFILTWHSGTGFIHGLEALDYQTSFAYRSNKVATEGWGLTYDGNRFILSSGAARLDIHNPEDFAHTGEIVVYDGSETVRRLNELEYVGGKILANIWKADVIAVIDPDSAQVTGWIDIAPLREKLSEESGVANGIAYEEETGRLFVTGKHWDKLFEIEIDTVLWRQPMMRKE